MLSHNHEEPATVAEPLKRKEVREKKRNKLEEEINVNESQRSEGR